MQTLKQTNKQNLSLYLLSFVEGGSLMAIEILSVKIIAPYFGNSLYVWSSVLATTLLGLAGGYYFGGNISTKKNIKKYLYLYCLISITLILLLPLTSSFILQKTLFLNLQLGITISSILLILPIIFYLGTVSPLIIKLTSDNFKNSGKCASIIYTISTIGGIIYALLTGLFFITSFGIQLTSTTIGITYSIALLLCYIFNK